MVVKVPPMMNTVLTPWNYYWSMMLQLVVGVYVVDRLVNCCGRRQVMNVSNVGRNSIFVGRAWLLGELHVDPASIVPNTPWVLRCRYVTESAVRAPVVLVRSRGE